MLDVKAEGNGASKFAAHFRFDMRANGHEATVAGLDALMENCMRAPVRVSVWKHLMSRYYITDERGPKDAQAWALAACASWSITARSKRRDQCRALQARHAFSAPAATSVAVESSGRSQRCSGALSRPSRTI